MEKIATGVAVVIDEVVNASNVMVPGRKLPRDGSAKLLAFVPAFGVSREATPPSWLYAPYPLRTISPVKGVAMAIEVDAASIAPRTANLLKLFNGWPLLVES